MSIEDYNKLNFIDNINDKNTYSILEDNIKHFLDWSLLNVGGFINVDIPTSGVAGGNFHQLKPVEDPESTKRNTTWEAPRKDWVYESGIEYSESPHTISGIYVNNQFLPAPTGSGNYGYHINYPMGRITFDKPLAATSKVYLNYAHRYVQIYKSLDSFWWQELQRNSYDPSRFTKNNDYNVLANHRIQPPLIMIETIARNQQIPAELGSHKNRLIQDVFLHIFTQNPRHRASLVDILLLQKDKGLILYNTGKLVKDNKCELNYRGEINQSGLNYNQITSDTNYHFRTCFIKNSILSEQNTISSTLYNAIIRWTIEIFV